jgi:hypothetical protein
MMCNRKPGSLPLFKEDGLKTAPGKGFRENDNKKIGGVISA